MLDKPKLESFCNIPLKELRMDSLQELNLYDKGVGVPGALVVAHFLHVSASLTSVWTPAHKPTPSSHHLLFIIPLVLPLTMLVCPWPLNSST